MNAKQGNKIWEAVGGWGEILKAKKAGEERSKLVGLRMGPGVLWNRSRNSSVQRMPGILIYCFNYN